MMNATYGSFFVLAAYGDGGVLRFLYFAAAALLYLLIVCSNVLLMVVIVVNRTLHEPMYLFLLSLFVNELYGSTGLFPLILLQILSDSHTVPAPLCFLQIFVLYTYASVQFGNLAAMSYDRYLAICRPLQYRRVMTARKVALLVFLTWLCPAGGILVLISLSSSLRLCGNVIHKVYCDNYSVVKLACGDTTVNNAYGVGYTAATAGLVLSIVYSYARILQVCFSGSRQSRQKAVSTCTPHLASLLNFSCGCFFEIVQNRLDMRHVAAAVRVVLSLYWLVCQPLFNPALYGLNLSQIRTACRRLLQRNPEH